MSAILFVSHDRDLREVASRVLRNAGWEVTAVPHGGHAVLACVAGQAFDVLVVDEHAPEADASTLARQLRRYCPALQTVSLQGRNARPACDAIAVVRPCTSDDLIDAVLAAAAATALASANAGSDRASARDQPVQHEQQDRSGDRHQPAG